MALSTFIKYHSKYEERYDCVLDVKGDYSSDNVYKLYDKLYPRIMEYGIKYNETFSAKRAYNSEERAYLEKLYEYLSAY